MVSSYLEATDAELAPLLPKSNCSRSQPTSSLADQVSSLLAEVLPATLCNALGQSMPVIPLFAAARIGETELVVTCAASAISIFLLHPLIEMIAVRAVVHQGSFVKTCELSFFLALLTGCSFYFGPIFAFFLQDSHLADLVGTYLKLFTPAIPAFALFIYLRSHAAVQGILDQSPPRDFELTLMFANQDRQHKNCRTSASRCSLSCTSLRSSSGLLQTGLNF